MSIMMKKVFLFCLLAVISVQAMPSLDDEAEDANEDVSQEEVYARSADEDVVKSRSKRWAVDGDSPKNGLNVDVDVDVEAPSKVLSNANVDVDIGIKAKGVGRKKNGSGGDISESCDCIVSLREEMKSLCEKIDGMLDALLVLKGKALANNGTGAAEVRSSAANQGIDVVGTDIKNSMDQVKSFIIRYCRWIHIWGYGWYYYCRYYTYGRKRRQVPELTDISNDEEDPDCIADNLAKILNNIDSYAGLLLIAEEELLEDPDSSDHVLSVVNPTIDLLNTHKPIIQDLLQDLENMPC